MATKRRSNDLKLLSISWMMLTITFTCVYWIANGIVWLVFGILAAMISGGSAYAHYRREGRWANPKPAVAAPVRKAPRKYKSRRQRARDRRSAVAAGKIRSGTTRMGTGLRGAKTCSARCRDSRMPARFCRCHCGGASHGELRRPAIRVAAATTPKPRVARPAAVRKAAPTKKPPHVPKAAPGIKRPQREVKLPQGEAGSPVAIIWRADDGSKRQTVTSLATARILKERGRLLECRPH